MKAAFMVRNPIFINGSGKGLVYRYYYPFGAKAATFKCRVN